MKKICLFILPLVVALNSFAQKASTLNNYGVRLAKKGKIQQAITSFEKAILLDEYFTDAYYNRALAYSQLMMYDLSIEDYSKAISLRPHFAFAYNNRGADRLASGDWKGALEDYNAAIALDSNYARAFFNRGVAYLKNEYFQKALADFNKALKIDPEYAEAAINKSIVSGRLAKTEDPPKFSYYLPKSSYPVFPSPLSCVKFRYESNGKIAIRKTIGAVKKVA